MVSARHFYRCAVRSAGKKTILHSCRLGQHVIGSRLGRGATYDFGRKDFLNTDLIDQMLTPQVDQMGSLLVVRQVRTDAIDHYHHERAIIHVEPIGTADKLIFAVSDEWTIKIARQVRLIET